MKPSGVTVRELIEVLEDVAEEYGDGTIIRLAMQPSWPFEYSIGAIETVTPSKREKRDGASSVCYLSEGRQIGYLPGKAAAALGWSDSDDDDDDDTSECENCGDEVANVNAGGLCSSCARAQGAK